MKLTETPATAAPSYGLTGENPQRKVTILSAPDWRGDAWYADARLGSMYVVVCRKTTVHLWTVVGPGVSS